MYENIHIRLDEEEIKKRDFEQIESDLLEIERLVKELNLQVNNQGEKLDKIDNTVAEIDHIIETTELKDMYDQQINDRVTQYLSIAAIGTGVVVGLPIITLLSFKIGAIALAGGILVAGGAIVKNKIIDKL